MAFPKASNRVLGFGAWLIAACIVVYLSFLSAGGPKSPLEQLRMLFDAWNWD